MERAALDRMERELDAEVRKRLPDAPIQRVAVLQYGDEPEIEPGELLARIILEGPEDRDERERVLEGFHDAHRAAIRELRRDLDKAPEAGILEFVVGGASEDGEHRGPGIRLGRPRGALGGGGDGPLVPVMARLAPADLETVDALITAGIAANRAEAVRWALARIRERPAYEKLRERAREIEELKAQF
jgi:hypothetical protein